MWESIQKVKIFILTYNYKYTFNIVLSQLFLNGFREYNCKNEFKPLEKYK
jgi:hypothetical protein